MRFHAFLRLKILLCFFFTFIFCSGIAFAQFANDDVESVDITGDKIEYQKETGLMIGIGNVVVKYKGVVIYAEKLIYDNNTHIATTEGRTEVHKTDGTIYSGDSVVYDFNTDLLKATEGDMFSFPWFGRGEDVEKVESEPREKYVIKNGYISTCGLDDPEYRIWASRFHVYPHDKIIAYNVVMMLRKLPVLYLPVYVHYLEDRPPFEFSYGKSSRWRSHLLTAYTYKIQNRHKGRLKFDWRELKGFAYGIDQEYQFKNYQGLYSFYWIEEKDKDIEDIPILGAGGYIRSRDRWRHKFQHHQKLPWDTQMWVQLYKVKDRNVLRDYYKKEYALDTEPETYIYFDKYHEGFSARLLWLRKINKWFTQIEREPEFDFDMVQRPIAKTGAFINYRFNAVRLEQDPSRESVGVLHHRTDRYYSEIELARPFDITSWLHAYPFIRSDDTYYSQDLKNEDLFRHATTMGLELNSKFWRVYDVQSEFLEIDKLRHVVEPSVSLLYRHVPDGEEDQLFRYDSIDEREGATRVRFRIDSRLQTKRSNVGSQWVRGRVPKSAFYDQKDLLALINANLLIYDPVDDEFFIWVYKNMSEDDFAEIIDSLELNAREEVLIVWQDTHDSYGTNKEFVGRANSNATLFDYFIFLDWIPEERGHSFSDVFAEMDFTPVSWLTISLDTRYDTRRMDFRSMNPSMTFSYFDNWSFTTGWNIVHESSSRLNASMTYRINEKWELGYSQEYDFDNGNIHVPLKRLFVTHNGHCAVTGLEIIQRRDELQVENVVWVSFYLKAFPEEIIETKAARYVQVVDNAPL